MGNELRVRATLQDEATKPVKDLRGAFEALKGPAGAAGVVMGVTASATTKAFDLAGEAVGKTIDFLSESVKAAVDEQAATEKMTAALRANVQGWDGNTEAISKRIDAGVRLAFSDDDVRDSFTKLEAATHDVNKAFDVQKVAMDLARLKGISLADASDALVKVEAGQYRALKSLGIVLREGATQTEALAAVEKVAAGQAAAYADTVAGKTEQLQHRFEQLQQKIGGAVVPALDEFTGGLVDLADATDGGTDAGDKFYRGMMKVDAVLTGLVMPGSAVAQGFQKTADAIDRIDAAAAGAQAQLERNRAAWEEYKRAQNNARLGMPAVEGSLKTLSQVIRDTGARAYTAADRLDTFRDAIDKVAQAAGDDQFSVQELGDKFAIATQQVNDDIAALKRLQAIKNPTAEQRADLAKTDLQVLTDKRDIIDLGSKMLAAKQISFSALIAQFQKLGVKLYDDNGYANDLLKTLRYISGQSGWQGGGTGPGAKWTPRAAGGPVVAGRTYLVGEQGPELLRLAGGNSGYISPNASTASLGSGGGGSLTINVSTPVLTPGAAQQLADLIGPVVSRWQQRNGLLPRAGSPMSG